MLRDKLKLYTREEWADAFGMPFWRSFASHTSWGEITHGATALVERALASAEPGRGSLKPRLAQAVQPRRDAGHGAAARPGGVHDAARVVCALDGPSERDQPRRCSLGLYLSRRHRQLGGTGSLVEVGGRRPPRAPPQRDRLHRRDLHRHRRQAGADAVGARRRLPARTARPLGGDRATRPRGARDLCLDDARRERTGRRPSAPRESPSTSSLATVPTSRCELQPRARRLRACSSRTSRATCSTSRTRSPSSRPGRGRRRVRGRLPPQDGEPSAVAAVTAARRGREIKEGEQAVEVLLMLRVHARESACEW